MDFRVEHSDHPSSLETRLLVVPLRGAEDDSLTALSEAMEVDLSRWVADEKFEGKADETLVFRGLPGLEASVLLLVGADAPENGGLRRAAVKAARFASSIKTDELTFVVPRGEEDVREVVEGLILGAYRFDRHLSAEKADPIRLEKVTLVTTDGIDEEAVDRAQAVAEAVTFARDLVNETPNNLTPAALAQAAADVASRWKLESKIFEENELRAEGFNLILAVGRGSDNPPRLAHLIYRPEGEVSRKIAFVGKGVTFDTGGYNIKPGQSMLHMHSDMAGAAAVLGAAEAIGRLRPEGVEVHFVVPTAENSISGDAMRPQDIIRGYGGKTVEIHNTDAEGRLILADALSYIQEHDVDTIVDLATLTGACVVALGLHTAALFSDDDELASGFLEAAKTTGESFWRMPLTSKLDEDLDTPMADMKNVGPRWGGAITAALFLKRWVELERWAHLDIAGPAYAESEGDLSPQGGTGFAVSTLVEYVARCAR